MRLKRGFGEGWGCSALHEHPKALTAGDAAPCFVASHQPAVEYRFYIFNRAAF